MEKENLRVWVGIFEIQPFNYNVDDYRYYLENMQPLDQSNIIISALYAHAIPAISGYRDIQDSGPFIVLPKDERLSGQLIIFYVLPQETNIKEALSAYPPSGQIDLRTGMPLK